MSMSLYRHRHECRTSTRQFPPFRQGNALVYVLFLLSLQLCIFLFVCVLVVRYGRDSNFSRKIYRTIRFCQGKHRRLRMISTFVNISTHAVSGFVRNKNFQLVKMCCIPYDFLHPSPIFSLI